MPQTQNSANLAATIGSIRQAFEPEPKDINFYDYDGSLLYSYTYSEAWSLTAMPALPTYHTGLTPTGWNYTFPEVKSFAHNSRSINVGAVYATSDGSTRLYLFVAKGTKIPSLQIHLKLAANTASTIVWGDGTTSTVTNSGSEEAFVYAKKTNYAEVNADTIICVKISSGSFVLGYNGSYSLFGTGYEPVLIKAELGANCTGIMPYAFQAANPNFNLREIMISSGVTSIPDYAFNICRSLKAVVLPHSITGIGSYAFAGCYELSMISIPKSVTDIGTYCFSGCQSLKTISLQQLSHLDNIKSRSFSTCNNLLSIKLPWCLVSIQSNAMNSCKKLYSVDLTEFDDPTDIPSLINANAFNDTPAYLKFVVANQEMLAAFSAATNWSTYAGQFIVG